MTGVVSSVIIPTMSNNEQQADMYSVGYDNGYKNAKRDSDLELRELKIKLEDALQWGTFWRECYHIEHNKLIVAEKTKKACN